MDKGTKQSIGPHPLPDPEYEGPLSAQRLQELFARCGDFTLRRVDPGLTGGEPLTLCWLDGLVSGDALSETVLRPLTQPERGRAACPAALLRDALRGSVYAGTVRERRELGDVVQDLTHGCCALLFESLGTALCFEIRSAQTRAVSEPTLEKSLKGAKDAFVEDLRPNTALVRRRLATPQLKLVEGRVGRKSATRVALLYMEGVADPAAVRELARRLDAIDVDALLAMGALEEAVTDAPRSPFPQLIHTERPDRFAMHLADGRVGLLVDGLPLGLVLPVTFAEFMKVTGDRSTNFLVSSTLSVLRYLALFIGLFLPALYVAMSMYHQEMIPTKLLLSMIEAKQDVPFSTALEVLGMLISFTLLQEAGLRLPDPIGDTVSIIGALIVGQAAVEARIVSPIAIIVVATAGICCYTLPSQDLAAAVRLASFLALVSAAAAGLFGVGVFACLLLWHLAGIDSFGRSYTAPLSESRAGGLARVLFRRPQSAIKLRDALLRTADRRRRA